MFVAFWEKLNFTYIKNANSPLSFWSFGYYRRRSQECFQIHINLTFSKSATIRFTVVIVGSRQKVFNLQIFQIFSLIVSAVVYFIAGALFHSDHFVLFWFSAFTGRQTSQVLARLFSWLRTALLSRPSERASQSLSCFHEKTSEHVKFKLTSSLKIKVQVSCQE